VPRRSRGLVPPACCGASKHEPVARALIEAASFCSAALLRLGPRPRRVVRAGLPGAVPSALAAPLCFPVPRVWRLACPVVRAAWGPCRVRARGPRRRWAALPNAGFLLVRSAASWGRPLRGGWSPGGRRSRAPLRGLGAPGVAGARGSSRVGVPPPGAAGAAAPSSGPAGLVGGGPRLVGAADRRWPNHGSQRRPVGDRAAALPSPRFGSLGGPVWARLAPLFAWVLAGGWALLAPRWFGLPFLLPQPAAFLYCCLVSFSQCRSGCRWLAFVRSAARARPLLFFCRGPS